MSLDPLPPEVERSVKHFAEERHVSRDEAILELISAGLKAKGPLTPAIGAGQKPGELLIGLFSGPSDAAVLDEAMAYSQKLRDLDRLRDLWR